MIELLRDCIGFACLLAAALGSAYALVAALLVSRRSAAPVSARGAQPGVSILKPLRGAESALHANLATFCAQDYAGPVQLLFGVEDESDPAVEVVRRLQREWPPADTALVVTGPARGPNPKVATLVGLEPHIRHPIVVLADSDIAVPRDYLSRIVHALGAPEVGLVTCLYRGIATSGPWSKLAAMAIDMHFLPGVLVGLELRLARPCFGSTIALPRELLVRIGGFDAFRAHLADDHAIGAAVRATGLRVAIPDFVVDHTCAERTFAELARHELRWARTIRAVDPAGHVGSVLTHALPLSLIGAAAAGASATATTIVATAFACRLVLALAVDHTLASPAKRWPLVPVRDVISFAIYAASFCVGVVTWRGRRYRVRADGTLAALGESNS